MNRSESQTVQGDSKTDKKLTGPSQQTNKLMRSSASAVSASASTPTKSREKHQNNTEKILDSLSKIDIDMKMHVYGNVCI